MRVKKKPVEVDAMQLPADGSDASPEMIAFLHEMKEDWESEKDGYLIIHTCEGDMVATPGDWIIKGVKGEFYPCKPDVFDLTYEIVT